MKRTIHVHQAKLRKGEPALIVRTYKGSPRHYRNVELTGPAVLVQPEHPDKCGARVWIETEHAVIADGMEI